MHILVLTRFLDVPAGRARPCAAGRALEAALAASGARVRLADPLDMAAGPSAAPPACDPDASLVLAALSPFRPGFDVPVARACELSGAKVLNSACALARFADPAGPLDELLRRGIAVAPWTLGRKPLGPAAAGIGFPAVIELFGPEIPGRRVEVRDAGSLDGILDFVWKKDAVAIVRGGISLEESRSIRVSTAGRAAAGFGSRLDPGARDAALGAAAALGLDFGLFDLRASGSGFEVVSALPFALDGPDDVRHEAVEAVARHAVEAAAGR